MPGRHSSNRHHRRRSSSPHHHHRRRSSRRHHRSRTSRCRSWRCPRDLRPRPDRSSRSLRCSQGFRGHPRRRLIASRPRRPDPRSWLSWPDLRRRRSECRRFLHRPASHFRLHHRRPRPQPENRYPSRWIHPSRDECRCHRRLVSPTARHRPRHHRRRRCRSCSP